MQSQGAKAGIHSNQGASQGSPTEVYQDVGQGWWVRGARWAGRRVLISHKHTQLVLTRMDFIGSIQHLIITREGTCMAEAIRSGCPHMASPHFSRPEPTPALRTAGGPTDEPRLPRGSQGR